jgi:hypothetical protein
MVLSCSDVRVRRPNSVSLREYHGLEEKLGYCRIISFLDRCQPWIHTKTLQGAGIARVLASQGNLAVALLARRPEALQDLTRRLRADVPDATFEAFPTDTSPASLSNAFQEIKKHDSFKNLKLELAIFSVKSGGKAPFMEGTYEVSNSWCEGGSHDTQ